MLEDRILIWMLKRGRETALVQVYEKYKRLLLKIASGMLRNAATAEDVVQDVFVALAESVERLSLTGSLKGYLIRSVMNRARNVIRDGAIRRTQGYGDEQLPTPSMERPDRWLILQERHHQLFRALERLPRDQRDAVSLHLLAELSFKEIASLQQQSINTVQSRYRYGLEKLRSSLCREADV
jgi:RNA polymerase sigma factor (sigma-70 family)